MTNVGPKRKEGRKTNKKNQNKQNKTKQKNKHGVTAQMWGLLPTKQESPASSHGHCLDK